MRALSRRAVLAGGGAAAAAGLVGWRIRAEPRFEGEALTPDEAHRAALAGEVVLIDVRRPEEWDATGVPEGAVPIDMRRDDFGTAVLTALGGDASRPVALICAGGVRSARVARALEDAGLAAVIDVPEGMRGSSAGPGWLERGLPASRPGEAP